MTSRLLPLPIGADEEDEANFRLAYASRQLLDPVAVKPLAGEVANGAETLILAAPPVGYAWALKLTLTNPNAGGGTAGYMLRTGVAGDIIDQRATLTVAAAANAQLNPPPLCELAVTLQVTAGTSVRYVGEAWLVPVTKMRYWRSPLLTNAYQAVTLPAIPTGYALRTPTGLGFVQFPDWQWALNASTATRLLMARVTRGGVAYEYPGVSVAAGVRNGNGCFPLPPLITGDTLEIRCTTSPDGNLFAGGAFEIVPLVA